MKIWDLLSSPEFAQKIVLKKLICDTLNLTREEVRTLANKKIEEKDFETIKSWYNDYVINKKPLEYILGKVTFFENDFFVNENTLVPRPETEYMIQAVTEFIPWSKSDKKNILLDIWTWCWVLWTSVLLQNPDYFPNAIFSDISEKALEVAQKNYKNLILDQNKSSTKVKFIQSDLVDFLSDNKLNSDLNFWNANIILVANLPYIPDETFDNNAPENVRNREPRMAFVGWNDWLDYYRQMFWKLINLRKNHQPSTINYQLFMEMMTRQVDILRQEFKWIIKFDEIKTFHFNIRIVHWKFL